MEIPVLQRLTDFEKASFQNPKLFSLSIFPYTPISNPYTFFKWTALILLAIIASFTTIFKSLVFRSKTKIPQYDTVFYDSDLSNDTSSISSVSDDEEDEDSSNDYKVKGCDFYLREEWENRNLRRRRNGSIGESFCFSEFVEGKNVVKVWDNSAEDYLFKVSDNRVASRIPAILPDWKPMLGRIVGGVDKIYVRDDVSGKLTVGDMRMPGKPLGSLTDVDVDTWWDANAVIVGNGSERVFCNSDF